MKVEIWALILDTVGTIMIAFAALRVHHRVLNEHKIDNKVFSSMRREQIVGVIGVISVLIGFALAMIPLV
jgi:tellurite resistance protein TehA-like permease